MDNALLRRRVSTLKRGKVEFFSHSGRRRGPDARLYNETGRLRLHPEISAALPRLWRAGSSTVNDSWGGYYLWHLLLTQKGYLVVSVDNRGTPAPLGRKWRKAIYGQLGVVETRDQARAAQLLAQRPYVDTGRVGIWGWSYGGFMSLNAIFQHPDLYRTAVVVSPVTHWSLYDNVYTERFNGLPTDNKAGYDRGSPLTYVSGFRGQSAAGPRQRRR